MTYYDQVSEAANFLRTMFGPFNPALESSSAPGWGRGEGGRRTGRRSYAEIPHFPAPPSRVTRGGLSPVCSPASRSS